MLCQHSVLAVLCRAVLRCAVLCSWCFQVAPFIRIKRPKLNQHKNGPHSRGVYRPTCSLAAPLMLTTFRVSPSVVGDFMRRVCHLRHAHVHARRARHHDGRMRHPVRLLLHHFYPNRNRNRNPNSNPNVRCTALVPRLVAPQQHARLPHAWSNTPLAACWTYLRSSVTLSASSLAFIPLKLDTEQLGIFK